jgi:TPR repeat protein
MDEVKHPSHYNQGPIEADGTARFEVIKVIEDWGLGFKLGNALKYILRAGHKGHPDSRRDKQREDLKKALWYLSRAAEKGETHVGVDSLHPVNVSTAWQLHPVLKLAVDAIFLGDMPTAIDSVQGFLDTEPGTED